MKEKEITQTRERVFNNQYEIGNGGVQKWISKFGLLWDIQIKKITKTPMLIFGICGLPLIILFGITALIPDYQSFVACFGMIGIAVSGIIFGDLYYTMEKSTLEKSTSTSNYGHKTKLFTIAFVTLVVSLISTLYLGIIFILIDLIDIYFMNNFSFIGGEFNYYALEINWLQVQWLNIIYYVIMNSFLTISIFILVKNFFASNKTFIMFVLTYVILDIVFGGVMTTIYTTPVVFINDSGQVLATNEITNLSIIRDGATTTLTWNKWNSYAKFFVPHYWLNQHFATSLRVGSEMVNTQGEQIYGWADGVLNVNWDAVLLPDGTLDTRYSWMLDAQNLILHWEDKPPIPHKYLTNEEFAIKWAEVVERAQTDASAYNGAYYAVYSYMKALPPKSSFWTPYNGDTTMIMCILIPPIYIVSLTACGFWLSRAIE